MSKTETRWACDNGCGVSVTPDTVEELESADGRYGMLVCLACALDSDPSEWHLT